MRPASLPLGGASSPGAFVGRLAGYMALRRVHVEVCLTSNLQTIPGLQGDLARHPFARMLEEDLSLSLCTDNTLVSGTTLTDEYLKAVLAFDLSLDQLIHLVMSGHSAAFFPHPYRNKLLHMQQVAHHISIVSHHYLAPSLHSALFS